MAQEQKIGYMSVFIQLCRIPYPIKSLKCKYTITCKETDKTITATHDFNSDDPSWGPWKFQSLKKIMPFESIVFIVSIEILNKEFLEDNTSNIYSRERIHFD